MRIIICASSCFIVSTTTLTMMRMLVPPSWRLFVPGMNADTMYGSTAMLPRNRAPPSVIRFVTRDRNSSVGLPGRMPGMKPPFLRR